MKKAMMLMFFFLLLSPIVASAQNNGLSIGYGFSFLTPHQETGEVKEDRKYNFETFAYFHQWSIFRNGYITLEPFVAYVNRPETGLEFGATLLLRYYIPTSQRTSLYLNLGGGGAHSTVDFLEQGSRNFFILAAGIGFKWESFFIENRFRHYSNAHLATPNDSVNVNMIMIGLHF
jgi:hypothetical protein